MSIGQPTSLILELVDSATSCLTEEIEFTGNDAAQLLTLLSLDSVNFNGESYAISTEDLTKITNSFDAKKFHFEATGGHLRARDIGDDLPYKLHTNRELLLMLKGEKPLAVFHDVLPWRSQELLNLCEKFEPYVIDGRFTKREYIGENFYEDNQSVKWIFFALPIETWRIDAYLLLKKTAKLSGWNDGFERMEGSLLGYTDEQNAIHLSKKNP